MPYKIVKQADKFCVAKEETGEPIKGGCHASRAEAVDHLQALYANEAMAAIAEAFVEETDEVEPALVASFTLTERNWSGPIVFEEIKTGDKRKFAPEAINWDNLPVPLSFQRVSGEGHKGSVVIGRVDEITREGNTVLAKGVILEGIPEADEFLALMEHGAAGGVSVDGDNAAYEVEEGKDGGVEFTSMRIRGLTAVAIPAFADANIKLDEETEVEPEVEVELTDEDKAELDAAVEELAKKRKKQKRSMTWHYANEAGLVAAAAPIKPPIEWFANPELDGPTALTVTPEGYVFGHLSIWNTCHIGMPGCTKPPKGGTYAYFHTGELETEDGTPIAVGHLTFNTGHASVYENAFNAASHYDNTGTVGADVVAGEDKHGIWVAGALRPELSEEAIRTFRAAPLSGDWRRIGNKLELVAALSVNTPGFPVPRSKALVASIDGNNPETVITVVENELFAEMSERIEFVSFLNNKVREIFQDDEREAAEARKAELSARVNPAVAQIETEEFSTEEVVEFCEDPNGIDHVALAVGVLDEAMKLHEGHMNGTEPTSEESQAKLMSLIESAKRHLADEDQLHEDEMGE